MSGGSRDYFYSKLEDQATLPDYAEEVNMLIKDLADLFHKLEWWESSDSSEESFKEALFKFRQRWIDKTDGNFDSIKIKLEKCLKVIDSAMKQLE